MSIIICIIIFMIIITGNITTATSPITDPSQGTILRISPDGKQSEVIAHGFEKDTEATEIEDVLNNLIKDMFQQPVSPDNKVNKGLKDFLSEITRRCEMKVVLSNALYFNGSWEYEFLFDPPYSGK